MNVAGAILANQVRSLDWRIHRPEFTVRLPDSVVREALTKARTRLDPQFSGHNGRYQMHVRSYSLALRRAFSPLQSLVARTSY